MKASISCSINNYLEDSYPEIYEFLRLSCANVTNLSHKNGITFLVPVEKKTVDKLKKSLESDNMDEFTQACNMLNAMIIYDVMNDTSDWNSKKDDIPNALRQHVEIDSVTTKLVKFKNGATAVLDEKFKPRVSDPERGPRLRVWLLTGEIPVTTDKPATFKYRLKKGELPPKKGGYSPSNEQMLSVRWSIAIAVENIYMFEKEQNPGPTMTQKGHSFGFGANSTDNMKPSHLRGGYKNAYLDYTMSLVDFISTRYNKLLFDVVLPNIAFQVADFYILLEPHKTSGKFLIDDDIIEEWWSNMGSFNTAATIKKVSVWLSNPPQEYKRFAVYSNRLGIIGAVDEIRTNWRVNPKNIVPTVQGIYNTLVTANRIGNISNIYPAPLIEYYSSNPIMKLIQDEMRYVVYLMMETMNHQLGFSRADFANIITTIASYTYGASDKSLKLFNATTIANSIDPIEKVSEINIFAHSTNFIFVPLSAQDIVNFPFKSIITKPHPLDIKIFNIARATELQHKRLIEASEINASNDLISILKLVMSNKTAISPEAKKLLSELNSTL